MKNIIKKTSLLIIIILFFSCKAQQQILPLNTFSSKMPTNGYSKDLNNQLDPFVGVYKATFNNRETILYISKIEKILDEYNNNEFYRDVINIKYVVKDSIGNILQDTRNINSNRNKIQSFGIYPDGKIALSYSGTNCYVGNGRITLAKISPTQISWDYSPDGIELTDELCPGNPDIKVYLPNTKGLIFTKQ